MRQNYVTNIADKIINTKIMQNLFDRNLLCIFWQRCYLRNRFFSIHASSILPLVLAHFIAK